MVNIRKANTSGIEYERKLYIPLVDILGNIQLKKKLLPNKACIYEFKFYCLVL